MKKHKSEIIKAFKTHYSETFRLHGATSAGVDWKNQHEADMRHTVMEGLFSTTKHQDLRSISLLDVGCGYGDFYAFLKRRGRVVNYSGIDLVPEMIEHARAIHPDASFSVSNCIDYCSSSSQDYAVCNGIGTQKLSLDNNEMIDYIGDILGSMYRAARIGCAMNFLTTQVDYRREANFYLDPKIAIDIAMNLSRHFDLRHSYGLFEYTLYLYKNDK